jgi:hypothetical protein
LDSQRIKRAFIENGTDKGRSHGYEEFYSYVFDDPPLSLLEIGVKEGRSLSAWRDLFPNVVMYGLDISRQQYIERYVKRSKAICHLGDSTKPETVEKFDIDFEVIIDDGSHFYKDIIKTFINFKDKFTRYYVIEDCMYKQDFVVKYIKRLGFKNVKVFDSKVKNVKVNRAMVSRKPYHKGEPYYVDLKFIVVER